jgi:hypothetical protein
MFFLITLALCTHFSLSLAISGLDIQAPSLIIKRMSHEQREQMIAQAEKIVQEQRASLEEPVVDKPQVITPETIVKESLKEIEKTLLEQLAPSEKSQTSMALGLLSGGAAFVPMRILSDGTTRTEACGLALLSSAMNASVIATAQVVWNKDLSWKEFGKQFSIALLSSAAASFIVIPKKTRGTL